MATSAPLHEQLQHELECKKLHDLAQKYSYNYIDDTNRTVYPSPSALENLSVFDEALPVALSRDGQEILTMLHEYGAPATVYQTGGKYFGFVNGNILPIASASRWMTDVWVSISLSISIFKGSITL